jgi:1-deoxy-D-xylulose-5-phosphate reductoisomerase
MTRAAAQSGSTLLPVDSEHNAIFQCLAASRKEDVSRIILTASGGPFRTASAESISAATPAQAVAHPNWSMGAKISVDSATLMNKGLELIEAHYLFGLPSERIDIVVHPQSVIHSMVEFIDGSVLAQLGSPDMRIPISYALAWPKRMPTPSDKLDLAGIGRLDFEAPDPTRFPALRLAREALERGGAAPIVLNAANEIAVARFLEGVIRFPDIAGIVEESLYGSDYCEPQTIEDVLEIDRGARRSADAAVKASC